jgi:hypothetical protein
MAFRYEGNMVFTTVEVFLQDGRLKEYEAAAVAATANITGQASPKEVNHVLLSLYAYVA